MKEARTAALEGRQKLAKKAILKKAEEEKAGPSPTKQKPSPSKLKKLEEEFLNSEDDEDKSTSVIEDTEESSEGMKVVKNEVEDMETE